MTVSEKHIAEAKRVAEGSFLHGCSPIIDAIAAALAAAEREGMMRAAEVVRSHIPFMPPDGPINSAHQIEYEALGFAMQEILSQAGEA